MLAFPYGVFDAPDEQFYGTYVFFFPLQLIADKTILQRGGGCNPGAYSSDAHICISVTFPIYILTPQDQILSFFSSNLLSLLYLTLRLLLPIYILILFCVVNSVKLNSI